MSELAVKVTAARERLPLRTMMEQRGKAPPNGNWKRFPKCPYCGKDGAGLLEKNGRQWFKCHHTSCPSGTAGEKGAWDEVAFLAYELGLNRKEAFVTWLKEAGIELQPPKRNGESRRAEYLPTEEEEESLPPAAWDESSPPPSAVDPGRGQVPGQFEGLGYLATADGSAAVPDPPPVADGVAASPAAADHDGAPTPQPGEASLSPAAGSPGATGAGPQAQDAAPPAQPSSVQTSASPAEDTETVEDDETERVPPTVMAMRWFHAGLRLAKPDRERLLDKRGLPARMCCEMGLRSSLRSNEALLRRMAELFPMNVLLDAGLWVRGERPSDEPQPNRFYFGYGLVGKRKNPATGASELEFGWSHPVLIPYLNRAGEVLDLRTHKWTQQGQAPRLYVPRRLAGTGDQKWVGEVAFAVITEGELKSMAIGQALWPRAIVAALPGITMSKQLWGTLLDWLLEELPHGRPVAVVFDNEDKGTEGLPGYKANWWQRHDSEKWARYLAHRLLRDGFPARVGFLPDGWRDAKGKADWDGALALLEETLGRQELLWGEQVPAP
ncbi:MAG TPA: hypothetical protein VN829_16020 [Dongiaceae bacterium]|nr:hypothetical protein [Dongiaceae bacterium]